MPATSTMTARRAGKIVNRSMYPALLIGLLVLVQVCMGQNNAFLPSAAASPSPSPSPVETPDTPLTDREKEMMDLIKGLQDRITKLETQIGSSSDQSKQIGQISNSADESKQIAQYAAPPAANAVPSQTDAPKAQKQEDDTRGGTLNKGVPVLRPWYEWEPGEGFKIAQSERASLNIGGYLAVRYMNQGPASQTSFTDHLGRTQTVKPRQDFQFHRAMLFLQGFLFSPKVSYNVTFWTVNDTAQNAIIGGISYAHNKHFMIGMGWNALPGTRSLHGSHPYWPSYDRVMADEFFRPYFTQGIFAQGEIVSGLRYDFMLGNNNSGLDVKAVKLTRDLAFGGSLTWRPTTKEFGPRAAFGDFESHDKLATQFGVAYTRVRDDRQNPNKPNEAPENTTIRLADSLNVFENGALAPGVTVNKVTYQLYAADAGMKYKGFWLQAEGYYRILDDFIADGPLPLRTIQDKGFYVQGSYMIVPKSFEVYGATSWVFSQMGRPKEFIGGANYYPFKNRNFRLNLHAVDVFHSPVNSTFGYYTGGLKGWSITAGTSVLF